MVGALPLATSIHEIALALVSGIALLSLLGDPERITTFKQLSGEVWLPPALVLSACFVLAALPQGNLREGLGHAWLLAPLFVIPLVVRREDRPLLQRIGLAAATLAAGWAIAQTASGEVGRGGFSHHLTLAYALVPPFAVAVGTRRWLHAVVLAAGSLASGSDGGLVALVVAGVGGLWAAFSDSRRAGPAPATGWPARLPMLAIAATGAAAALAGMAAFASSEDLRQRAILWTGGLSIRPGSAGAGDYGVATESAYDALSAGFYFPNHAHDSAIQLWATLGPAGCVAAAAMLASMLLYAPAPAAAGLAGVLIGGMTQDVLGDLEVARAAWVWVALLAPARKNTA
jgi:hypothetical protein